MRTVLATIGVAIFLSGSAHAQQAPKLSDEDYARQVLAAGPESVAKGAAVVRPEPDGSMRTIRQGSNGFTCLAMGTDRMCADKNSMAFIHALMSHQPPPDQVGVAYMLGGDTGLSGEAGGGCNTSPDATQKDPNCHWVVTGPHIMVVGPSSKRLGYPETPDPDPTKPDMMWANTPYEHAMVPVK
ncbi:MAG: hypothetical protein JOY66_20055 [Acetobacteraceae bacterium]|nr:hypothetical protein [Acetobacteraceae bacterium]